MCSMHNVIVEKLKSTLDLNSFVNNSILSLHIYMPFVDNHNSEFFIMLKGVEHETCNLYIE